MSVVIARSNLCYITIFDNRGTYRFDNHFYFSRIVDQKDRLGPIQKANTKRSSSWIPVALVCGISMVDTYCEYDIALLLIQWNINFHLIINMYHLLVRSFGQAASSENPLKPRGSEVFTKSRTPIIEGIRWSSLANSLKKGEIWIVELSVLQNTRQ